MSSRVLILGGTGMLGHKLWQLLRSRVDTWVTVRRQFDAYARLGLFDRQSTVDRVDAYAFDDVRRAIDRVTPDVIVNCIGIIKQLAEGRDPVASITINSLLPHLIARASPGVRMIQISTDCVFAGTKGDYTERDAADADDLYGRSKRLGEVSEAPALTLRTSIIGRELAGNSGVIEWFLSNRGGRVRGYTDAVFSGLTTLELSRVIASVVDRPDISGVYHVSGDPLAKYDLLRLANDAYRTDTEIIPSSDVKIDRTLDSSRFRAATGWTPPGWAAMISEMATDTTPYDDWRKRRGS